MVYGGANLIPPSIESSLVKTVSIDFNDPSDLKRWISRLQKRRKSLLGDYNPISFNGSKQHCGKVMPIFDAMIGTCLDSIYSGLNDNGYYVYFHCDPTKKLDVRKNLKHLILAQHFGLKNEPFYVGKGKGGRAYELDRNDGHRKIRSKLIKQGKDVEPIIAKADLLEMDALAIEAKIIDILGLKAFSEHGLLVNLDEGVKPVERRNLYPKEAMQVLSRNGFFIDNMK
jgi:hypothetical protein